MDHTKKKEEIGLTNLFFQSGCIAPLTKEKTLQCGVLYREKGEFSM